MVAAVGNNLPHTVAGDNDAVEWFLMWITNLSYDSSIGVQMCLISMKKPI